MFEKMFNDADYKRVEFLKVLDKTKPTDKIMLDRAADLKLLELWEESSKLVVGNQVRIPSDLLFAKTIPLMDCLISIDDPDSNNGKVFNYRVAIFPDYQDLITRCVAEELDSEFVEVGAIEIYSPDNDYEQILPIIVAKGQNVIGPPNVTIIKDSEVSQSTSSAIIGNEKLFISCLETWYGIQIALLHPVVKGIFRNPSTDIEKPAVTANKKKRKNNKVRYIKKYIINADELDTLIYGEEQERKFKRTALIWPVVGHWRELPNEKSVFVKPYFKGALRETKMVDKPRHREIAQLDNVVNKPKNH